MNHRRRSIVVVLSVLALSTIARAQVASSGPPPVLTLEQALQDAEDHYPTVRAAVERVNVSTADVAVARAASLPRFDSIWQTTRATANNIFGQVLPQSVLPSISGPVLPSASGQTVWGSAAGGLFSWEPFDLGLREAAVREAEGGVAHARAQEALTRLAVQNAVGAAFLALVNAQQAVVAAEADGHRRDVLARVAHALADNELRPGAEASRADAERAAAQTRAIQAREAVSIAQATLGQMLGVTAGPVSVNAAGLLENLPAGRTQDVPVAAHPLARAGQTAVDLARAREGVLTKTDRPRLYLQSSLFARGSGANPDGSFDGGTDGLWLERVNWAAGVQVIFPNLFDFASLRARRTASAASTRAESARYDEALLAVTSQQQAANAFVEAAQAIALNTPMQLTAARQGEAQARARYEAGLTSIVEVAEAQSLLAVAEYQNAAARVDVWRALLAQAVAQGSVAPFVQSVRASGVQ
ncbi:MAG: TolC family protein [Vicinamibacterales bacterium]